MIGLCFIKRNKNYLMAYIPLLAIWATLLIATPVYSEFRYIYCLFTTLPVLSVIPFAVECKKSADVSQELDSAE